MKKISIIFLLILFGQQKVSAQQDSSKNPMQIKAGLTLVPQGSINLKSPDKNFEKSYYNLFAGLTLVKGDWFNTTFYSMTFKQVGTAIGYNFIPNLGMYIVGCKNTTKRGDYLGVGVYTPLADGRASGFIEVGSGSQKWQPGMYVGMFIPFTRKIK